MTMMEAPTPQLQVRPLHLPSLDDKTLGDYELAVLEERDTLKLIEHQIRLEVERRLNERKGRALLHPGFERIELEDQFTQYVPHFEHLEKAQRLLKEAGKDEDAAKVMRRVPDQTTVIAAHNEAGNPVSIAALIRKYGEDSEIGQLLAAGLTRTHLTPKLVMKPKVVKP